MAGTSTAGRPRQYDGAPTGTPVGIGHADATPGESRLIAGLVVLGVVLRLWQYLSSTSLYWGELALARNVGGRTMDRLMTGRTAFGQASSYGYVFMQKVAVSIVGNRDLAHRFFPFAASVIALALFVRLTRTYLDGLARAFAIGCFAIAVPLVLITPTFKPLATVDLAATLALFLVAHDLLVQPADMKRTIRAGLIGFLLMWFAEAAGLVAAGAIVALSIVAIRRREPRKIATLAPAFVLWIAGAAATALAAYLATPPDVRASLHDLYDGGTLPPLPHVKTELAWLWARTNEALGRDVLLYHWPAAFVAAMAVGAVALARRNIESFLFLVMPAVAALVASALSFYIFQTLYIAFLFPYFFILVALGLDVVRARLAVVSKPLGAVWMAACFAIPVWSIAEFPPPYRIEDTKPVFAYVRDHRQPADAVYGFFAASHAIAYYGPRYGFGANDITVGDCHHGDPRSYFTELDRFRGRPRVWLIFAHDLGRFRARDDIVNYLNHIGTLRDSIAVVGRPMPTFVVGAYGYLYDLSDSTKLASTTAATMPLLRAVSANQAYRCGVGLVSASEHP